MEYKNLETLITEKAEGLGWKVRFDTQIRNDKIEKIVSFAHRSPAGEDFNFVVSYDKTENIIHEVSTYCINFDEDKHIEKCIDMKRNGVEGIPSIKKLVEDAEAINKMLEELYVELDEEYYDYMVSVEENNYEIFRAKVIENYDRIMDSYSKKSVEEVINKVYYLNFINEWYAFLSEGFEPLVGDTNLILWLSEMEDPLNQIYELFLDCDFATNYDWDVMFEWLSMVYDKAETNDNEVKYETLD